VNAQVDDPEGPFTATFKLKVTGYGRSKDVEWLRHHLEDQMTALLHREVLVILKKVVRAVEDVAPTEVCDG